MDVKEVQSPKTSSSSAVSITESNLVRTKIPDNNISEAATSQVASENLDSRPENEARLNLNRIIETVNVTQSATQEIGKLVESISGIVEQALQDGVSSERRKVLEKEGNNLINGIKEVTSQNSVHGLNPLTGDKIKIELYEKFGKSLEYILPDDAQKSFGLSQLDFSTVDAIISTRANVLKAQRQYEKLNQSVTVVADDVRKVAESIDVAKQNKEASQVSVRDLDSALKLADDAVQNIKTNRQQALKSFGDISTKALDLLKS